VQKHGSKNVVYFDETGFQQEAERPHGWAIIGKKVYGKISGNNRKRTNLIMAQRGEKWFAPMLFDKSCTHKTNLISIRGFVSWLIHPLVVQRAV
jgi:hypothetical protein